MSRWRVRSLILEGLAGLVHPWRRATLLAAIIGIAFVGVGLAAVSNIDNALDQQEARRAAGANVIVFRGGQAEQELGDSGQISTHACVGLSASPLVLFSGGLESRSLVSFDGLTGYQHQSVAVRGDVLRIWTDGPIRHNSGLVIGRSLSDQMGLGAGDQPFLEGSPLRVGEVFDPSQRYPSASGWIIVDSPSLATVDECWVEFSRFPTATAVNSMALALGSNTSLAVQRLLPAQDQLSSPLAVYNNRPTRWAWAIVGLFAAGVLAVDHWFRRGDLALYRALGSNTLDLVIITGTEAIAILGVAALAAAVWSIAIGSAIGASLAGADARIVLREIGSSAFVAMALSTVPVLLARGTIADLLKGDG